MCNKGCKNCVQDKALETIVQASKKLKLQPNDTDSINVLMNTMDKYLKTHINVCMERV